MPWNCSDYSAICSPFELCHSRKNAWTVTKHVGRDASYLTRIDTDQYVDESSHAFDVLFEMLDALFVGALFLEQTRRDWIRNPGQSVDIDTLSH